MPMGPLRRGPARRIKVSKPAEKAPVSYLIPQTPDHCYAGDPVALNIEGQTWKCGCVVCAPQLHLASPAVYPPPRVIHASQVTLCKPGTDGMSLAEAPVSVEGARPRSIREILADLDRTAMAADLLRAELRKQTLKSEAADASQGQGGNDDVAS